MSQLATDTVLLEKRRNGLMTIAGVAVLLSVAVAVSTSGVLFSGNVASNQDAAFSLAAWSLVVTICALIAVVFSLQRANELAAATRLLVPDSADLSGLLHDTRPDAHRFASLAGMVGASSSLAVAIAFVTSKPAGWAVAVIGVLALTALAASAECLTRRRIGWRRPLEELADGASALRDGRADEASVRDAPTLRLTDQRRLLAVRIDRELPAPELSARHILGEGAYREESSDTPGWRQFRRIESLAPRGTRSALTPAVPLAARLGPPASAVIVAAAALAETLSVLKGGPDPLPGWALESAFIYASARAGIVVLGLALIANLLIALASGRLVSKLSPQGGFELDAAVLVAEAASGDRASAAALLALDQRIDSVQDEVVTVNDGTVRVVALVNARMDALTQALAEFVAPGSEAPSAEGAAERRDEPSSSQ